MKQKNEPTADVSPPLPQPIISPQADPSSSGGFRAWSTTVGGWLVMFCVFGYANAFGVFQDLYTRSNTVSPSNVSWIGSTEVFLMISMSLPAGKLVDLGYFKLMTGIASICFVFCVFMLSLVHVDKYYQLFLAQGIGIGLSGGFLYLPAVAIQAKHWKTRRALAMGIVFSGSSMGGIVFPIMLNQLLYHSSIGFAWAIRATGFLVLVLLGLAWFLMDPGPKHLYAPQAQTDKTGSGFRGMITDVPYATVTFGSFLVNCGFYFPYFYVQLFSVLHGVSPSVSFYTLAIMNAASTFGRTLPNFLADTMGPFNNYVPACVASSVLVLSLLWIKNAAGIVVFALLYGFFTGAVIALVAPLVTTITKNPAQIGTRMGATFFVMSFGSLLGTPIQGALLGRGFLWWRAIAFSSVCMVSGSFLIAITRGVVAKRLGSHWV